MIKFEVKKPTDIPDKGISIVAISHNCSDFYFALTKNKITSVESKAIVYYDFNSDKWCGLWSNCELKEYYK